MAALDDDALRALWTLSDRTGVRPEYLIPVLSYESGLDPSVQNRAGLPYYGIAQTSGAQLAAMGIDPASWLALPASEQIARAVGPYFASAVARYGPIRSATRAYQANLLPATLATARGLGQIVALRGSAAYEANRQIDRRGHGAILVDDLAALMGRQLQSAAVESAIARAYVLRPAEQRAPAVYGHDFVDPAAAFAGAVALALVAGAR